MKILNGNFTSVNSRALYILEGLGFNNDPKKLNKTLNGNFTLVDTRSF